jgi:hypothetical protein
MHLRQGELDGVRLISADAATEMRQITMSGGGYDFGLGWFVPTNRRQSNPAFVEHLGGDPEANPQLRHAASLLRAGVA